MKSHWIPTTLKLTAKQARVLWGLVGSAVDVEDARARGRHTARYTTLLAILRKLEGKP